MRPVPPPATGALSRRSLQGMLLGAAIVPLTGCDLLPRSTPAAPPPPTPDEVLVDHVTTALRAARDVAAAAPHGQPVVAMHDAHLAALGSPATPSAAPSGAATQAPSADLRTTERALQATLTEAAGRAHDGDLARLLASIAASVAQQLAVLTSARPGR